MKKLIIIMLYTLLCNISVAQQTHVIEPAVLNVEYLQTKTASRHFELRVGKNTSSYFQRESFRSDSLFEADPETARIANMKWIQDYLNSTKTKSKEDRDREYDFGPGDREFYYFGMEKGTFSCYLRHLGKSLFINEAVPDIDWTIVADSTKFVFGYECTMATTYFRGRHWEVWFSPDISVDAGPWKLRGLPGLIMEAKCDDYVVITCIGINTNNPKPVTFYNFGNKKYKQINRLEYLEIIKNATSRTKDLKELRTFELE